MKPNISNISERDELLEAIKMFTICGPHACYCEWVSGKGCECAMKDEYVQEVMAQIDTYTESVAKRREIEARLSILSETIHQATTNLKSATAVAGWAEMRKKMIKEEQSNE